MYQELYSFESRKKECNTIRVKYPHRIPCIIQLDPNSKLIYHSKIKYLVPEDSNVSDIIHVIRKSIKLNYYQALFFRIGKETLCGSTIISSLYNKYKEKDGFLYIYYTEENTFG